MTQISSLRTLRRLLACTWLFAAALLPRQALALETVLVVDGDTYNVIEANAVATDIAKHMVSLGLLASNEQRSTDANYRVGFYLNWNLDSSVLEKGAMRERYFSVAYFIRQIFHADYSDPASFWSHIYLDSLGNWYSQNSSPNLNQAFDASQYTYRLVPGIASLLEQKLRRGEHVTVVALRLGSYTMHAVLGYLTYRYPDMDLSKLRVVYLGSLVPMPPGHAAIVTADDPMVATMLARLDYKPTPNVATRCESGDEACRARVYGADPKFGTGHHIYFSKTAGSSGSATSMHDEVMKLVVNPIVARLTLPPLVPAGQQVIAGMPFTINTALTPNLPNAIASQTWSVGGVEQAATGASFTHIYASNGTNVQTTVTLKSGRVITGSATLNVVVPSVSSVSPLRAEPGTTARIAVAGSNLVSAMRLRLRDPIGGTTDCALIGGNSERVDFDCPVISVAGDFDLELHLPGAIPTSRTLRFVVAHNSMAVTSITPLTGFAGTTMDVTVAGNYLPSTLALTLSGQGACTLHWRTATASSQSFSCVLTTAGSSSANAQVSTGGSAISGGTATFTVAALPVINQAQPRAGTAGSTQRIELSGTNLSGAVQLSLGGVGCTLQSQAPTLLAYTCSVPAVQGEHMLSATVPGSDTSYVLSFNSTAPVAAVSQITPLTGPASSSVGITVSGSNLPSTLAMTLAGQGSCTPSSQTATASSVTFTCALINTGSAALQVLGAAGGSVVGGGTATFQVTAPPPQVSSLSPNVGTAGTTRSVTVAGSNLPTSLSLAISNQGSCSATSRTASSATFDCVLQTPGDQTATVKLSTLDTGTLYSGAFIVSAPPPTVSSITPNSAVVGVPAIFTVAGTYLPNHLVMRAGSEPACTLQSGATATSLRYQCTFSTAGTHQLALRDAADNVVSGGTANVTVTAPVVTPPAPVIQGVSPPFGTAGTTVNVTIMGENLPLTLQLTLPNQGACTRTSGSSTQAVFSCQLTTPGSITLSLWTDVWPNGTQITVDPSFSSFAVF